MKLFRGKYHKFVLIAIILAASLLRLYNVNWDANQHLHPDERFLTMVVQAIRWPDSLQQYLDPQASPLSPYNSGYKFYVYGTLPIKIVKFFSGILAFDSFEYNNVTLVGRVISAMFDLGTLLVLYKIAKLIFNKNTALLASFLYAITVLPIQLSHFFATETFLVFFITLTFYLLIKFLYTNSVVFALLSGMAFGLAIASKISALLFLPIVVLGLFYKLIQKRKLKHTILTTFFLFFSAYFSFRLANPEIFLNSNIFNPKIGEDFVSNIKQLESFNQPDSLYPPAVQWVNTIPIIYPLKNMLLWGLGLPLGIITLTALVHSLFILTKQITKAKRFNFLATKQFGHFLLIAWIFALFVYQGVQFAKALRYFYPIYPALAIISAGFLLQSYRTLEQNLKNKNLLSVLYSLVLIVFLIWPFSFISIYSRPHSRISASKWIYNNIPKGKTISCEHWDDCLPLGLGQKTLYDYEIITLPMFNPDNAKKWQIVKENLKKTDYLILSSNRVWGSVLQIPERYPQTIKFYENLFSGKSEFEMAAEFVSYPTVPVLNIPIPDQSADETFTVYDHPKVIIFKRI